MITNVLELKDAIQNLESERVVQLFYLKEEFQHAYESINPLNLITDEPASSRFLGNNMISTSIGLATGYLFKKWIIGKSENPLRAMVGSAVQIGAINLIAKYQGTIEILGRTLLQLFLHKNKKQDGTI